ncbi:MAG TPA: DUF1553 domain-containing protein [Lacipirellulaceae bacterium]|nr:DUF1553 domain-containing protein [Lacipirellulaceae bacterium]
MTRVRIAIVFACAWSLLSAQAAHAVTRPPVSYDRDIRPILSDKCYRCHGPDAESRQAKLRLDTHEGLTAKVVVVGKPDKSELIRRIFSTDDDERMPPPDSKLSLSPGQKDLLRRWIAEGATFAEHWSFLPLPDNVALPTVHDESWPRGQIDQFVLAQLEAEKLRPAPAADRLRLLRRVTLDLTGLPPTADECREFESANAQAFEQTYQRTVDRLLASPAFGEQMAVAWLDAARYADSYGYQSDQLNSQWPYRDWVVAAFNQNMPYDQFLTWQLAGDLLDQPSRDQILATAFNRLHRLTNEGGSIADEWLVENAADRAETFGTAILGLTVGCARCHDHKYDPITMRDYYSLTAFFNSIDENGLYDNAAKTPSPSLLLPTPQQQKQLTAARNAISRADTAVQTAINDGQPRFDAWLASVSRDARGLSPFSESSEKKGTVPLSPNRDLVAYYSFDGDLNHIPNKAPGATGEAHAPGLKTVPGHRGKAIRFDGDNGADMPGIFQVDRWDNFTLDFWMRDQAHNTQPVVVLQRTFGTDTGYNGFDLMLQSGILSARLYRVWPGNAIGVQSKTPIPPNQWQHVAVTYDGSSTAGGLHIFLNGQRLDANIVRNHLQKKASLKTFGDGHLTLGQRFRDRGFKDGEIDELRVYNRALTPLEIANLHDAKSLAAALADPKSHRDQLEAYYLSAVDTDARHATQELREARRQFVEAEEPIQEIPVMKELPKPRPTYILTRGRYDAPKTQANRVTRNTFAKLLIPFPKDAPRNRLGLAQWLTDPHHPLTARVCVNRVWANFFGRGLVTTPENFGQQGAPPTHPKLLDWLARDFINHHWDIKRLCRTIVLSATYRQDSRCSAALRERDPENQLLARGPSHRLSAEQIRDLALAASGLLERRMGGPPVSPYQPGTDLWREANSMSPAYLQSTGRDLYRRSIYSVWKRTTPLPNMVAFDAPSREVCTVSRSRTNTPLQALVLLNDVQFVEAARALAASELKSHHDLNAQIDEAFLRLTGRHPDTTERDLLTDVYNEQFALFSDKSQQNAAAFAKLGDSRLDPKLNPVQVAALAVTCQAILNLDATIFER